MPPLGAITLTARAFQGCRTRAVGSIVRRQPSDGKSEGSLSRSRDWLKPIPPALAVKREDHEDPDTVEIWR